MKAPIARIMGDAPHARRAAEHAVDFQHGSLGDPFRGVHPALSQRPERGTYAPRLVQRRRRARWLLNGAPLQGAASCGIDELRALKPGEKAVERRQFVSVRMTRRLVRIDEIEPQPTGGEGNCCARHRAPNLHDVPLTNIHHVAVGSTNPVKVAAVRRVLERLMPSIRVDGVATASGVPDQPHGDDETIRGATNRAKAALAATGADLGVGIEGGVVDAPAGMRTCAWAVVATPQGAVHVGGSLSMPLPDAVAALIRAGEELGPAIDQLVGTSNIKHGAGAVGVLTEGLVTRQQAYEVILAYALAPVLTGEGTEGVRGAEYGGLVRGEERRTE